MKGNISNIHVVIQERGFQQVFVEYKKTPIRRFKKNYGVSHDTLTEIFGPKISIQKKIMIRILRRDGDSRSLNELINSNIL